MAGLVEVLCKTPGDFQVSLCVYVAAMIDIEILPQDA